MKPDWQNKSYAKSGAATGPSTMHAKLKVGMSSLHSKIGSANSNMPQAPKPVAKPAIRKFADGGMVRTRSDDEIGDTDMRTGRVDPGSYDRRMKAGAENMERLRSAADTIKSFFSKDKGADTSASNATTDSGMSESDMAKKQAMSGGYQMAKTETESPRRSISDYMAKPTETESKTEIQATPVETGAAPAPAEKAKVAKAPTASVSSASAPAKATETAAQMREKQLRSSGGSRGARVKETVTDTGDETARIMKRSGTKFVPGFGSVDKEGNIVRGQRPAGPSIGDALRAVDKGMTDAGTKYLKSKMDRGETLSAMEKAQAKRAGLI
jgi:hypothetical protein